MDIEGLRLVNNFYSRFALCTCGSHNPWEQIKRFLELAEDKNTSFYAHDTEDGWLVLLAHILDLNGLIEHGTGIGTAWLTPIGVHFLKFLREYGCDTNNWPIEVFEG
jgi:hypothetical protein